MRVFPPPTPPAVSPATAPLPGVVPVDTPETAPGLPAAFVALGDRVWPRVDASPTSTRGHRGDLAGPGVACWYVRGAKGAQVMPALKINGSLVHVVRLLWELTGRGPLARVTLTPLCENRRCVRPSHWGAERQRRGAPSVGLAQVLRSDASVPPPEPSMALLASLAEKEDARTLVASQASVAPVAPPVSVDPSPLTAPVLLALLSTPGVNSWCPPIGNVGHVWTPWGNFWGDTVAEALSKALAAAPETVRRAA